MLAAAVSRDRAQAICWHERMVWAAFPPQVPGLALLRSTRARPPGANFGPRGLCVMVGSGAQFRSGLATTYVWLPEKSEVRLTSCPLRPVVNCLSSL